MRVAMMRGLMGRIVWLPRKASCGCKVLSVSSNHNFNCTVHIHQQIAKEKGCKDKLVARESWVWCSLPCLLGFLLQVITLATHQHVAKRIRRGELDPGFCFFYSGWLLQVTRIRKWKRREIWVGKDKAFTLLFFSSSKTLKQSIFSKEAKYILILLWQRRNNMCEGEPCGWYQVSISVAG